MEAAASSWRRLGRLLVEDGLITEDQLDEALENQVRTRRLLGDIVVELGYVAPDDVQRALANQAALATGERAAFGTGLRSATGSVSPGATITEEAALAAAGRGGPAGFGCECFRCFRLILVRSPQAGWARC